MKFYIKRSRQDRDKDFYVWEWVLISVDESNVKFIENSAMTYQDIKNILRKYRSGIAIAYRGLSWKEGGRNWRLYLK